jgi:hypothetical protein
MKLYAKDEGHCDMNVYVLCETRNYHKPARVMVMEMEYSMLHIYYITLQIWYLYMVVKNTVDHYCCFSRSRRYCTRRRSELPNFGLPHRDGEKKPSAAQVAKHPWWQSNASLRLRCCRFHHSPTCCHREDAARTGRSFFLSVASWNVSRGRKLALGETWLSIGVRPLFWKFTR